MPPENNKITCYCGGEKHEHTGTTSTTPTTIPALIRELREKIEEMKPTKPYPNASNNYQRELDAEDKIVEDTLNQVLNLLKQYES